MRTQSIDTNKKNEEVVISLIRKAKPSQKFAQIRSLSQPTLELSRRAISRKNNNLSENEIDLLFINYHYGKDLADRFRNYIEKRHNENS